MHSVILSWSFGPCYTDSVHVYFWCALFFFFLISSWIPVLLFIIAKKARDHFSSSQTKKEKRQDRDYEALERPQKEICFFFPAIHVHSLIHHPWDTESRSQNRNMCAQFILFMLSNFVFQALKWIILHCVYVLYRLIHTLLQMLPKSQNEVKHICL